MKHVFLLGIGIFSAAFFSLGPNISFGSQQSIVLKPDLSIGVEDGNENLMFGSISRIALDGRNDIFVLDYKFRKVSVFDQERPAFKNHQGSRRSGTAGSNEPQRHRRDARRQALHQRHAQGHRLRSGRQVRTVFPRGFHDLLDRLPGHGKPGRHRAESRQDPPRFRPTGKLLEFFRRPLPRSLGVRAMKEHADVPGSHAVRLRP